MPRIERSRSNGSTEDAGHTKGVSSFVVHGIFVIRTIHVTAGLVHRITTGIVQRISRMRYMGVIVHALVETLRTVSTHVKLIHLLVVIGRVIGKRTALETLDPISVAT